MSLTKFKQLIDEDADILTMNEYIRDNYNTLLELQYDPDRHQDTSLRDDTDPYTPILRCFFMRSLTHFTKTEFPWKMVQNYYLNLHFGNDDRLTKQDLEEERMVDVHNGDFYFDILKLFLVNHEINDIPESFIKHFENIDHCYILYLGNYIRTELFEHLSDLRQTIFPHKIASKRIELLILFLERFDNINTNTHIEPVNTKRSLFVALKNYFFDIEKQFFMVNDVIITENNVIDFCFAKLKDDYLNKNGKTYHLTVRMADYFEFMQLDQQMEFWNILMEENKVVNDTIDSIFKHTTSDAFLNFAFDNYEPLKTEDGIYNIIMTGLELNNTTLNFYHMVLRRYPSIRSNLIIYLVIVDNYVCKRLFPDLTNQEIISIFREKFL